MPAGCLSRGKARWGSACHLCLRNRWPPNLASNNTLLFLMVSVGRDPGIASLAPLLRVSRGFAWGQLSSESSCGARPSSVLNGLPCAGNQLLSGFWVEAGPRRAGSTGDHVPGRLFWFVVWRIGHSQEGGNPPVLSGWSCFLSLLQVGKGTFSIQ